MPGRQRNTVVCLCALERRHVSNSALSASRSPCVQNAQEPDFKEMCDL